VTSLPEAAEPEPRPVPPADLAIGAFTDRPPWLVDLAQLTWRHRIEQLRAFTAAEVPVLLRPRRVRPGGRVLTVGLRLGTAIGDW
jgi:ubiquinone biosynthesis protein